jgi:hypothetical protein
MLICDTLLLLGIQPTFPLSLFLILFLLFNGKNQVTGFTDGLTDNSSTKTITS